MSVTGVCSVCENREATHVCERCGGAVCEEHYESPAGVCVECAMEMGGGKGGSKRGGENGPGPL